MPPIIKFILPIAKIQQSIGTMSIMGILTTNKKKLISIGYTEKEINDMIAFSGFSINDTLLKQMVSSAEFIKETKDLPFPKSIPYFKVISKQTFETNNKQLKTTPQEYQYQHLKRIGDHAQFEVLDGSHFIYINNVDKISNIIDRVILNI